MALKTVVQHFYYRATRQKIADDLQMKMQLIVLFVVVWIFGEG
jgi:hypothetical protein